MQHYEENMGGKPQRDGTIFMGEVVMFTFSDFDWKYLFGQSWSKKSRLSVRTEILH